METNPAAASVSCEADRPRSGGIWPGMIFVLIGINVMITLSTLYLALADGSVAVEPDYYGKAVRWDDTVRQREANARLGWAVSLDPAGHGPGGFAVRVQDQGGSPITDAVVAVELFHQAASRRRFGVTLEPRGDGVYAGLMPTDREGFWEFRVTVTARGQRFTAQFNPFIVGQRRGNAG
ncbi:MAG: FixH family protein [Phycisphaeraceae bacterium]|nr:MAG: FixH family protein [Phycisphaeraceae bacterium]